MADSPQLPAVQPQRLQLPGAELPIFNTVPSLNTNQLPGSIEFPGRTNVTQELLPPENKVPDIDKRADGSIKGPGFLGPIALESGEIMTEGSVHVRMIDGREILLPVLVPTLTDEQLSFISRGGDPRSRVDIMKQAIDHAELRIKLGQSPFLDLNEDVGEEITETEREDVFK